MNPKKLCPCCGRFVDSHNDTILPHKKVLIDKDCVSFRLQEILSTMDVPPLRKNDLNWLNRNLGINNRNKLDFDLAQWCIKNLLKNKGL